MPINLTNFRPNTASIFATARVYSPCDMSQLASATAMRPTISPMASPLASSRVSCAAARSPSTNWQSHNRYRISHRSPVPDSALRSSRAASSGLPAHRNAFARSNASRTFP